jgi:hypothetical protein
MFNSFNIDISRIAAAAVGALVLSTACVGAAVGPARAVETDIVQVVEVAGADEASA